jgi:hypothetical protein
MNKRKKNVSRGLGFSGVPLLMTSVTQIREWMKSRGGVSHGRPKTGRFVFTALLNWSGLPPAETVVATTRLRFAAPNCSLIASSSLSLLDHHPFRCVSVFFLSFVLLVMCCDGSVGVETELCCRRCEMAGEMKPEGVMMEVAPEKPGHLTVQCNAMLGNLSFPSPLAERTLFYSRIDVPFDPCYYSQNESPRFSLLIFLSSHPTEIPLQCRNKLQTFATFCKRPDVPMPSLSKSASAIRRPSSRSDARAICILW